MGDPLVQFNPIYQSSIVRIARWSCDGHMRTPGEPAWSRAPTFAFVLHGLFRRHVGKAEILAAPGDALFFPEDSEYRTSHPRDGGDHGIGIRVDPGTIEEIWDRAGHRNVDREGLPWSPRRPPGGGLSPIPGIPAGSGRPVGGSR